MTLSAEIVIALTLKLSFTTFFWSFSVTTTLLAGIKMKGAVYSSLPIPRFTHALLNESEAALFSFSKSPVVPTSCLEIQVFFSGSQILTVQYREFPIIIWLLCQPYMPKTSSRIAWSTLAFLYNRSEIPFSPILPTLHSISSACKLLIFNSTAIVPAPFKTQWTGCGKHLHWYTGYKSPASLLSAF